MLFSFITNNDMGVTMYSNSVKQIKIKYKFHSLLNLILQ